MQRIQQGRSRPMPENVYKSQSLELQMIWEFLGSDPPINCRRTLDQFGYPSLRDTRSRDDDQMLYKLTKERGFLHGFSDGLKSQWSSSRDGSSRNGSTGNNGKWKDRLTWLQQNVEGNEMSEEDVLNGNVLMVDQLWLWTINTGKLSQTLLLFQQTNPLQILFLPSSLEEKAILLKVRFTSRQICVTAYSTKSTST